MQFKKVNPRQNFPELEKDVIKFWRENKIFEKSVSEKPEDKMFSFFDGPPFATGLPHYGHLLAGTIKDVIPRFKTMQGYRVERIWGWDTHGLPIENIVEQELNFRSRIQIEEYGVDKFNEKCKSKVLAYADEWKKIVERTGRWVDMENAYLTMDFPYMESVWWVFKSLWEKDLIYKGHRVMPYCPRCATGLSAFEVGGEYKDKNDQAVTVKFELEEEPGTFFLAWTTTPWTLPGNLALTLGKNIEYVKVQKGSENYFLAKARLDAYKDVLGDAEVLDTVKGSELLSKKYKPVLSYYADSLKGDQKIGKAFVVIAGDYVTTEDGTGIVHTAPAFGEDDYRVCKENGIDFFMPVNDLGEFEIEVPDYAGKSVVEFETNNQIIKDLGNKAVKVENISHSYPHCWRCHTPLIYKAIDSWFVAETKLKEKNTEINKGINWIPNAVGSARFANLLDTAPDWNISRNRFWGTPLPVWKCDKCDKVDVFGSGKELADKSGKEVNDLHLHSIQNISYPCACGGTMSATGEVLDCWFESGSMPYGQMHYPFENKEKFEKSYPADFIAEGIDQTRGWFHSLLVLSSALFDKSSYKNVVVNGIVLAQDGQKMSKHLNNYPDPTEVMEKYGADAMRFYLMASPAVKAGDLSFSEKGVEEVVKSLILRLWNSYSFFVTYADLDNFKPTGKLDPENVLDKWLLSVTNELVRNVTNALENYDISKAARLLNEFIEELSNWYIRRSRKRFWKSENDTDKNQAYETLYYVLTTYVKLLAPFMPFVTEEVFRNLAQEESVHLADWPAVEKSFIEKEIEESMDGVREIIERGLSERAEAGIKIRQPLAKIVVEGKLDSLSDDLANIIKEEVNVKAVEYSKAKELSVELDKNITPELKAEGMARDFVRFVQAGRKKAGFNVEDRIILSWVADDKEVAKALENQKEYIAKETLALEIKHEKGEYSYDQNVKLDGKEVWFGINRK